MRALPTFRGYTVDVRLREFRKVIVGRRPEFIPFDSRKGFRLLLAWAKTLSFEEDITTWE